MIRVLLTDDHTILRSGIRALLDLQPDLEVVGEAGNGQELLQLLATTPADVVLMDINMPIMDGFATMEHLHAHHPNLRVLVLSMLDHESYVHRMLEAGAHGYVLKNADITEISHGIRTVAAGRPFLCTEVGLDMLDKLMRATVGPLEAGRLKPGDLSKRELEVLHLIAEGLTNSEIADRLFTSKRTIETHRQNIIEKTQTKNTAALIRFAVSNGLLKE
jgi:DNA-binding NarL/FixJ family response regulator